MENISLFIEKVRKMREAQKDYFKTRNVEALQLSKMLEREVDNMLNYKGDNSKQISLF